MGVKLGQKWAVKDGNLLASNQVGSRFFNKEFDFSRASNGTYVDRDGLLKTAELYNLIPYSEDFSVWTKIGSPTLTSNYGIGPFGVKNSTRFETTIDRINMSVSAINIGDTFSIYVKGSGTLHIQLGNTNNFYQEVTSEWVRYDFEVTIATINNNAQVRGSGTPLDVEIFGAQLVEGTQRDYQYTNGLQGLPRISFEDGVGHLLLEPQRTNLITYSEDFTQATWIKTGSSVVSGFLSPDGGLNAFKLVEGVGGTFHFIQNTPLTVSSGATVTHSIYAKKGERDWLVIGDSSVANQYCWFDLLNGVIGSKQSGVLSHSIEFLSNGFYKCIATYTVPSTVSRPIFLTSTGDGINSYTGDGTSGVYIWGAQAELGSYSTSLIHTSGTSVTRLADVCNNSGSAQDFNSEEGVLYAEIAALVSSDSISRRISLSDGTTSHRILIWYTTTTNQVLVYVISSGSSVFTAGHILDDSAEYNKIAVKYKENDFALWIDGVEIATDTSGTTPIGLNTLEFAQGNGGNPFYGKARNLQVFTEALSDAELISLTT